MINKTVILGLGAILFSHGIQASTLLNHEDKELLSQWLGENDLHWESVWQGNLGDSAESWHEAVDNIGPTVSIYNIIDNLGETHRIGGFTNVNWSNNNGYYEDEHAFLFNLDTGSKVHIREERIEYSVYVNDRYFANFGGGHDLFGGLFTLGNASHNHKHSYDYSENYEDFTINGQVTALETFAVGENYGGRNYIDTLNSTSPLNVPLPSSLGLLLVSVSLMNIQRKIT